MAQDLLWQYAQRRRIVDAEFSSDLETALRNAGYVPPGPGLAVGVGAFNPRGVAKSPLYCEHANEMPQRCPCRADCYCRDHSCKQG